MASHPLPAFTHNFFWDVNVSKINPARDYFFVIERLIEYGNDRAIKWLLSQYSHEQLQEVVRCSRNISKKTASLWQNYYDLPREEIRCFKKSYQGNGNLFWNY